MIDKKYAAQASKFALLFIIWLAAYRLSALAEVLKPYSSLWFIPAGVSLSVFLIAPGWLKLAPLAANLSLALPGISSLFGLEDSDAYDQVIHAIRHCGLYYAAALVLEKLNGRAWPGAGMQATLVYILVVTCTAVLSAATGVTLHALAGNFSWSVAANIVVHWAIGDAVGALVIPSIAIPALSLLLGLQPQPKDWPPFSAWLAELGIILVAMAVATIALMLDPALGSLWYITLLPPIFAGVRNGIRHSVISVFLTASLMPLVAKLIAFNGEPLALSIMLAITAVASLLVGTAVSLQKATVAQLDAQNQRLEEAVRARTAELADAYEFERHLVRSLGHDLRQPLQTITMLVEGMAMRKNEDEPVLNALRQISATMSNFLDGVLNYALTDPGTLTPNLAPVSTATVFGALDTIYRPIADKRGVRLIVLSNDAEFETDDVLLRQALSNDLDNAIRLSAPGGAVTLRHELRDGRHALIVADEIAVEYAHPPGTAGFGYGIVARVCNVLKATRIKELNIRGILLP